MRIKIILLLIIVSCASNNKVDRLENTKRLVRTGHQSLYENGALEIPYTKVKLIAPGPDTLEITKNLVGIRAKESLLLALLNIKNSYGFIKAYSLRSYLLGKNIYQKGGDLANLIDRKVDEDAYFLVQKSLSLPKASIVKSIEYSKSTTKRMIEFSNLLKKSIKEFGEESANDFTYSVKDLAFRLNIAMREVSKDLEKEARRDKENTTYSDMKKSGEEVDENALKISRLIYESSSELAKEHFQYGADFFIQGYLSFPEKISKRISNYNLNSFVENFEQEEERRSRYTENLILQIDNTLSNYTGDVRDSFKNAKIESEEGVNSYGLTLGLVKSLAWLTKAIFWDASIKPIGEMTIYSLGFLATNTIIYPTMVVSKSGYAVTELAVEFVTDFGETIYDFTAPTAVASVASIFSFLEVTGGLTASALMATTGKLYNYSSVGVGVIAHTAVAVKNTASTLTLKTSSKIVDGASHTSDLVLSGIKHTLPTVVKVTSNIAGEVSQKSIQYIGVPLASVGIPLAGSSVGVGLGVSGAIAGASYKIVGEVAEKTTLGSGTVLSGTTVAVGTTASVLAGLGIAGYESLKGVAVPSSYVMGSGIVLTYGNLTQLAAQTILAASDLSYLVLSLEGPKWILYGVKDKLNLGNKLGAETVIDLNKLKQNGEEFESIPISEEEVIKVLNSF